jgi:hypothetical protein
VLSFQHSIPTFIATLIIDKQGSPHERASAAAEKPVAGVKLTDRPSETIRAMLEFLHIVR